MILSLRNILSAGALILLPLSTAFAESMEEGPPPPATLEAEEIPPPPPEPPPPTVITSDHVEMVTVEGESHFVFSGNVKVSGNNLIVFCDLLEVFSSRAADGTEAGVAEIGRIQRILATGKVRIEQEDRLATSGRAELFPVEGRIVLTDSPVIRNEHGTVSGHRITLNQGESQAVVEGGAGRQAEIVLPSLPDLGTGIERRPRGNEGRSDR
jgi:lipopolysaccharide export system protein LptA